MKLLNGINKKESIPSQKNNSSAADDMVSGTNRDASGPPRSVEFPSQDTDVVNADSDGLQLQQNGRSGGANSSAAEIAARSADQHRRSQSFDLPAAAIAATGDIDADGEAAVADDDATRPTANTKDGDGGTAANLPMGRNSSFYSDDDESGHGASGRHNSMLITDAGDDDKEFDRVTRNRSADDIYMDVIGGGGGGEGGDASRDYASSGTKPINHKPFHASTGNIILASKSCTLDDATGSVGDSGGRAGGGGGGGGSAKGPSTNMRRRPSLGLNMSVNVPLPFKSASAGEVPSNVGSGGDRGDIMGAAVNLHRRSSNPSSQPDDVSLGSGLDIKATFQKEHKAVRKFKIIVVLVLVAAAVAVTILVYKTTSATENDDYQTQYNDYADKFITNFHHVQVMRQWAAYTTAGMYTARSLNNYGPPDGNPWPNVTLPDYADQMRGALVLAHATTIEFSPLFVNDQTTREQWEEYAVDNEAMSLYVPSWAMITHGGGQDTDQGGDATEMVGDGSGAGHGAAHDMGASAEHDGSGEHGTSTMGEHGAMIADEMGEEMQVEGTGDMEMTMDYGTMQDHMDPAMEEAVEIATSDEVPSSTQETRKLRRRRNTDTIHQVRPNGSVERILHGHNGASNSNPVMGHDMDDAGHGMDSAGDGHVQHPSRPVEEGIYTMGGPGIMVDETFDASEMPLLAPAWQIFPLMNNEGRLMYNEYSDRHRRRGIDTILATRRPALTEVLYGYADHHHFYNEPSSILMYPVFDSFKNENTIVGLVSLTFSWIGTFWNILPENVKGVTAVIETSTGQKTSFRVDGKFGTYLGEGDFHDSKYDDMERSSSVYRVYGEENNVKEMKGHHLMRWLQGEAHADDGHGSAHEDPEAHANENALEDGEHIDFIIRIFPSDDFYHTFNTNQPRIYSLAVSLVFLVTVISFLVYDVLVERRQKKLLDSAERSGKIVSSLFPAMVRDRLFKHTHSLVEEEDEQKKKEKGVKRILKATNVVENTNKLKKFISQAEAPESDDSLTAISNSAPPIADLYNDCTILFADIAGFTAWSSEREPAQVFQLLEPIFSDFDTAAKNQGVFKIETIGDCYVAVTGLPDPNPDHAVVMATFAQQCLQSFSELTKELELALGPGTADLGIRIGLHSGPVTAGVLRGAKARFQLFGDTMNTASRMESTSIKNMIQVTAETATILTESGKGHTLIAREGLIKAKGKGLMQTYWLRPKARMESRTSRIQSGYNVEAHASRQEEEHIHSRAQHDEAREELGLPSFSHHHHDTANKAVRSFASDASQAPMYRAVDDSWKDTGLKDALTTPGRQQEGLRRLIKWNTAVLESILTKVVIQRSEQRRRSFFKPNKKGVKYDDTALFSEQIAESVDIPRFNRAAMSSTWLMPSKDKVSLIPAKAREELRAYVARIASMYRDVHFHSFEHASHVTMSAQKLINKVVLRDAAEYTSSTRQKDEEEKKSGDSKGKNDTADLFFSTYGISADPLAQFAVVFAALVHDVDHTGVPNVQLIKEKPDLGAKYKDISVAENNSIKCAWSELMQPEFANLRKCIFETNEDETRFRQLLINVVIATDIADRERRAGERVRWEKAFAGDSNWEDEWKSLSEMELSTVDISLKATVVLEQIVLASDVAHTMQHWLTYVKWNERLYKEMWAAYENGRAENDPTENWYKGEIGFFDGYIIPLATKLKDCGVFGSAGDEYLGNALRNKAEWIEKGKLIVEEFEAKIKRKSISERSGSTRSLISSVDDS